MAPLLHSVRLFTLLLFAVAVAAAFYYVPQPQPLALSLAALGGFAMALARLRHWGLALAAALAPFPGVLWFGTSAYALIVAFAIMTVAAYADAVLKSEDAPRQLADPMPALAGALLFAILWSLHTPVQLASLLAATAATLLCLPFLVLAAEFDEEAFMRGNRQRETALRFSAMAGRIAEPRWSLSLAGAGLVLAVLGYFQITLSPPAFDWLAAPLVGVIILGLTRDMYAGLGGLAAAALLLLFTAGMSGGLLLFLLFAVSLGRSAAAWRRAGESEAVSWARSIEEQGVTLLFAGLAAVIAATPRGGLVAALHALLGMAAALILYPAMAGALRSIFPRRRSLEELYRP